MSNALEQSSQSSAKCPRCGYDQRGVMASWTESCPLVGGRSECGLEWTWSDVLQNNLFGPPWCIESVMRCREVPRRAVLTILMMFRPTRFWNDLRMLHRLRAWPFVGMLALFAIAMYLTFVVWIGVWTWRTAQYGNGSFSARFASAVYAGAMPLADKPPAWYQGLSGLTPREMTISLLPRIGGWRALGTFVITREPNTLWGMHWVVWLSVMGFMAMAVPLGFIAVPISRRRAKVRGMHLARITFYSLIPACLTALICQMPWSPWIWYNAIQHFLHSCWLWYPIFLAVWWTFAIRHYLKMNHAMALAISLSTIASLTLWLVAAVLCILLYP